MAPTNLLDVGDAARAGRVLERSLKLWRGAPLADFRDQPFVDHEVLLRRP